MSKPKPSPSMDPALAQIAALERHIIAVHDAKAQLGVSADELARQRPAVVNQARAVAEQLRSEYLARITKR